MVMNHCPLVTHIPSFQHSGRTNLTMATLILTPGPFISQSSIKASFIFGIPWPRIKFDDGTVFTGGKKNKKRKKIELILKTDIKNTK